MWTLTLLFLQVKMSTFLSSDSLHLWLLVQAGFTPSTFIISRSDTVTNLSPSELSFSNVCQFLPCEPSYVNLPFLSDIGTLSRIAMDHLDNSDKFSSGTLINFQCSHWSSQSHILTKESVRPRGWEFLTPNSAGKWVFFWDKSWGISVSIWLI